MKVCFETFGCRLNKAEALEEEARYLAQGWGRTSEHSDADLFVISGCSVTARAQHECERLIEHLKQKYPTKRIIVRGCIDAKESREPAYNQVTAYAVPTRTSRAYLKVQDGCNGNCTFCIVPKFRGAPRSEAFDSVIDKAKRFIEAGYHEIIVTGCNLSLYSDGARKLPELVAALAALSKDCRIRLGSVEPNDIVDPLVEVMADSDNVCNFLHLPIQSASNVILHAMGRPYMLRDIESMIMRAINKIPNISLGCDIITGFPGETMIDYRATRGFLKRMPFVNVHAFPYSVRPGTKAASLSNEVPREERKIRAKQLTAIAEAHKRIYAKRFLGREVQIVVENPEVVGGWTAEYLWCEVVATKVKTIERKSIVNIRVRNAHNGRLKGFIT